MDKKVKMDWSRWASIARLSIRKICCLNGSRKLLRRKYSWSMPPILGLSIFSARSAIGFAFFFLQRRTFSLFESFFSSLYHLYYTLINIKTSTFIIFLIHYFVISFFSPIFAPAYTKPKRRVQNWRFRFLTPQKI